MLFMSRKRCIKISVISSVVEESMPIAEKENLAERIKDEEVVGTSSNHWPTEIRARVPKSYSNSGA